MLIQYMMMQTLQLSSNNSGGSCGEAPRANGVKDSNQVYLAESICKASGIAIICNYAGKAYMCMHVHNTMHSLIMHIVK